VNVDAALRLPENATLEQAATLAATLPAALARGKGAFSVDASALKAYDTSTIALLLQARRSANVSSVRSPLICTKGTITPTRERGADGVDLLGRMRGADAAAKQ
jgi:ABC-type transporter Mla MlaB component